MISKKKNLHSDTAQILFFICLLTKSRQCGILEV
nr:MAG TPA: hypothetical protein [Caudoviricetes sp.]